MKKNISILVVILMMTFLAACGTSNELGENNKGTEQTSGNESNMAVNDEEEAPSNNGTEQNEAQDNDQAATEEDNEQNSEGENDDGVEVFESTSKGNEENQYETSENLLDGKKVFKHDGDSMIFTIENANFTKRFTTSNPKDESVERNIITDSEIYLHITGTVENETKDSISFAGPLGFINFNLIYDGKHEFHGYGTIEEQDGSDFKSGNVDAFTTGKAHYYSKLPIAVSESDKPLDLIVMIGKEEYKIKLR